MSYRLAPGAQRDLEEITTFLLDEYPAVAPMFEVELRRIFDLVTEFPGIGRPGPVSGTRELPLKRYPYIVIFYVDESGVSILRIFRTARDPQTKLR